MIFKKNKNKKEKEKEGLKELRNYLVKLNAKQHYSGEFSTH